MELTNLHGIMVGLESLAAIEKKYPVLGSELYDFVSSISSCCDIAYGRLATILNQAMRLSSKSSPLEIENVRRKLSEAPNSKWFKDVSGVCDRLATIAMRHSHDFDTIIDHTRTERDAALNGGKASSLVDSHYKLVPLFSLLEREERDLKLDIRAVVNDLLVRISEAEEHGNYAEVRQLASSVQNEIGNSLDQIMRLSLLIKGTSSGGASSVLGNSKTNSLTAMRKIFISHSSKDVEHIKPLIRLLEYIGVPHKQIFFSSLPAFGVRLGSNIFDQLKNELNSNILAIFILSKNFYKSPVCLCEMGAVWINSSQQIPILIPPFKYSDVKGVFPDALGLMINEKGKLNSLKGQIEQHFGLTPINSDRWEDARDRYLDEVNAGLGTYK